MNHGTTFSETTLGATGLRVRRLGLAASYWPGRKAVHYALDHGVNYFFAYGWDRQMVRVLRDVPSSRRQEIVIATGAYNWLFRHSDIRRSLEKRLRQFRTDYIDVFQFLGVLKPEHLPPRVMDDLLRLRAEGKVRAIGISTHDRKLAGQLAAAGTLDTLMIRYNAAHRGAERDIFPQLAGHNTAVIGYTATRWGYLLRRPKAWPRERPVPSAEQCYRFVLSNDHVHVCLTAPRNLKQTVENLRALDDGPLSPEELSFMQEFGDVVYCQKKYFM
jgi:aryl-alcohol dehydrogenase-like predicted oxidoreductase